MKINNTTELMKNQKHAVIMSPQKQFEVLQTQEGRSLFFSISTDEYPIFYCTREVPGDRHGWTKMDLTATLPGNDSQARTSAKNFAISQDLSTGKTDIALVATVEKKDFLYLSLGNANSDAVWSAPQFQWTLIPFDDDAHNLTNVSIENIYINRAGNKEYIMVDILADPGSSIKNIFRYFIDPTKKISGKAWEPHDISGSLEAGSITNALGRKKGQPVDGTYVMGTILDEPELLYIPLYNPFAKDKKVPPETTRMQLPAGATAMALSFVNAPYSDLFVTAGNTLYFLSNDMQTPGKEMTAIYSNELFKNVKTLHTNNFNSQVVVWGLNEQGQVFHLKCSSGNETDTRSWSVPVPIMENADIIASFINSQFAHTSLFVQSRDNNLVQLMQDATTPNWRQRNIVLPAPAIKDLIETFTFTTHIQCTDDYNMALSNASLTITATETCSIYINDVYHLVHTEIPLQIKSDVAGVVTIIQPVDSIGSICYKLSDGTQEVKINPMNNVLGKLQDHVNMDNPLDAKVKDEKDVETNLVGKDVTDEQKKQMADYIKQFVAMHKDLPADGTQKPLPPNLLETKFGFKDPPTRVFGLYFGNNDVRYFEGADQAGMVGLVLANNNLYMPGQVMLGSGEANAFEIAMGDAWQWLKNLFEELEHFFVQIFEGIAHIVMTIADAVYHFALRCIGDILQGIQFVLSKIAVVFADLVKWVGNIFGWNDVIRTHRVLKSVFNHYITYTTSNIENYIEKVSDFLGQIKINLDEWAELPTDSYQKQAAANNSGSQSNTPSANWASHHTKSNINSAEYASEDTDSHSMLDELLTVLANEGKIFVAAVKKLKDIFSKFRELPFATLVKQVLAVIVDAFLDSAKNIITEFLKIAEGMVKGVQAMLNTKLDIPVISPLYKIFADDDLTMLDLVCLVAAIPVTFIYKILNKDKAPFPDDDNTKSLLAAEDFDHVAQLCFDTVPQSRGVTSQDLPPQLKSNSVFDKLAFAGNMSAGVGGVLIAILGSMKSMEDSTTMKSGPLYVAYACCYLPYIAPDILGCAEYIRDFKKGWYNDLNALLAGVSLLKSFVDIASCGDPLDIAETPQINETVDEDGNNIPGEPGVPGQDNRSSWTKASPIIDFFVNALWQVPAVYAYKGSQKNTNDKLALTANTLFNVTGVLSPFIACASGEPKVAMVAASAGFNLCYAAMSVAISVDGLPTD